MTGVQTCALPILANPVAREALARELFDWCYERMAYFKPPGWILFVDSLPTGTSANVQKIHIFPNGSDPRQQTGVIDLRALKKQKKTAVTQPGH